MKTVTSISLAGQQFRRLDLLVRHLFAQFAQVLEQMGILVLERRAAGGAVDDHGIHVRAGEELQGFPDASAPRSPARRT